MMIERIKLFLKGWRRRSLMLLDVAGCPPWLAHWRCRPTRKEREWFRDLNQWLKAESDFEIERELRDANNSPISRP